MNPFSKLKSLIGQGVVNSTPLNKLPKNPQISKPKKRIIQKPVDATIGG
jgi:hypothetical protein